MPSIASGLDSIIKKYFNFYRNLGQLPPFLENKIQGKLIEKLEKTYYYDINRKYCIFGRLDEAIALDDGTFVPLDHKTRASAPTEVHQAYQLQMSVYTLLLRENDIKVSNFAYLVYYFPEESKIHNGISFGFKVEKVETDPDGIKKYIEEAIKCLESDKLPPSGEECEYCKWVNQVREYYFAGGISPVEKKEIEAKREKKVEENKNEIEIEENFKKGTLF